METESEWISYLLKILGPMAMENPKTTVPILVLIAVMVFAKTCGKGK